MKERKDKLKSSTIVTNWLIILGTSFIIIISLLLSWLIIKLISRQLKSTADIAESISSGNYDVSIEIQNDKDYLGKAINKMTKSLKDNTQALNQEKTKLKNQDWIKTTQSNIINKIQGIKDVKIFANTIMSELIPALDAHVGLFYFEETKNNKTTLSLLGSYAYKKRKDISNQFSLGEGLVGQCALEKKMILLTEAPEKYIEITSGSGKGNPRNILIVPILFEDKLMAVIEVGSIQEFSENHQALIELVSETIGVVINNIISQQETENFLVKSQELSEKLKKQQEDLETSNKDLKEKTKILQESEEELKIQSEEMRTINEELEDKSNHLEKQKKAIEIQNTELQTTKEEVEKKAEELEKSGAYKSEFLANMSHELRTPLNSLLILSKSLADNDEGNLTEEQVEECTIIHNGGQELLMLINDILDLSKVEAGKMELVVEEVPIQNIVTNMKSQFKPVAEKRELEFIVDIADDLPETLCMDIHKVAQVLKNLLSNAFKFTKTGSVKLQIYTPNATQEFMTDTLKADKAVAFSVVDTGIGIPANKQADIFEAFQQADGSTSREFGGTGLGLTISRQLALLMEGEIHLKSEENKGTTFTLYLPMNPTGAETKTKDEAKKKSTLAKPDVTQPSDASENTSGEEIVQWIADDRHAIKADSNTLLIIEDDKIFATLLLKAGKAHGFLCLAAEQGKVGLQLAEKYQPNAIVLDLGLPDMNGEKVLAELNRNKKTQHIPVHIISAAEKDSNLMKAGVTGFLQKPVKKEDLEKVFKNFENNSSTRIKRVLIIEDDVANQKAMVKLIKNEQLDISIAENGAIARDKILNEEIDCIILDLNLPDISGLELLKSLAENKISLPPVTVYTGKTLTDEEYSELREFTSSIIVKGADSPERLLDEVSLFLHSVDAKLPKAQQQISKEPHTPEETLEGHHILLVDDDMRNLFSLSKVLKKNGLNVEVAKNGQVALDMLAEKKGIELVIMDIMMPVMDGYTTIEKIRAQDALKDLPIIALTAKAMPEDQKKCIDVGANDYLAKPLDVERLLSLMRVWLRRT
ncbi:MAG: response regulator [Gammaproteobacteria bacterium]|nr:response regulator [Gammaproteobacteria bacterium]